MRRSRPIASLARCWQANRVRQQEGRVRFPDTATCVHVRLAVPCQVCQERQEGTQGKKGRNPSRFRGSVSGLSGQVRSKIRRTGGFIFPASEGLHSIPSPFRPDLLRGGRVSRGTRSREYTTICSSCGSSWPRSSDGWVILRHSLQLLPIHWIDGERGQNRMRWRQPKATGADLAVSHRSPPAH